MTKRALIGIVVGILLVVVLFTAVEFRLMRSNTRINKEMASGHTESVPPSLYENARLNYGVLGEGAFAEALFEALEDELEGEVSIQEANPLEMELQYSGDSYLLAALTARDINWLPIRGRTEVTVRISYSSDGDVTWRNQDPPTFVFEGEPGIKADGTLTLVDSSWGLFSLPGYRDYVAVKMAAAISDALNQVFDGI